MRTTVMFSSELMRAAKARCAEQGESLKALLTRAVEAELGRSSAPPARGARVSLPVFGDTSGKPVRLSNAEIERFLAEADAATVPPPRSKTRARARRRS